MEDLGEHPALLELSMQGSLMDSPRFKQLCFLVLVAAAPCPNIAMPSANPAERTQDSSSGKTSVTVYHCKDCEISACELPDYEMFAKIGETQNVKFSNEKIHLVTSEINITMCFLQENTFPEGIYAIFWQKDVGVGDSCGIVDFEVSSEIERGNIINICCTVDTDPLMPSSPLNCYPEMSSEKTATLTADVTAEATLGNPQRLIGEKNSSIGIITTVVILVVCAASLAIYCVRQTRNRQGPVIVLHQFFSEKPGFNSVNGEKCLS